MTSHAALPASASPPPLVVTPQEWAAAIAGRAIPFASLGCHRNPPDWGFSNRRVPDQLLYFVSAGQISVTAEDQHLRLTAGDLIWLAPNVLHTVANTDRRRPATIYYLRPSIQINGRQLRMANPIIHLSGAWDLQPWLTGLIEDKAPIHPFREQRLSAGLTFLFTDIFRLLSQQAASGPVLRLAQQKALLRLAQSHVHTRLTTHHLARSLNLSPDYFTRVFKRTFNLSPRRWLMELRIRHAASRLSETTLTITQIARETGYNDVFLFSRQFKSVIGQSPRNYRIRS